MSLDYEKYNDKSIENNENNTCQEKHPYIFISSNLEVEVENKNKTIYLLPGKVQYFKAKVLKSSGDVNVRYKGYYSEEGICGKLGIYRIVENGIIVKTYNRLNSKDVDTLSFTLTDNYTNECSETSLIFSYDEWQDCRK